MEMMLYIMILCFVSISESAIFYVRENDWSDEPMNLEYYKLQGMKVNTNSVTLKNDLRRVIPIQADKIAIERYDESVQAPENCKLDLDKNENKHRNHVPDLVDYKNACEFLVGTSIIPFCGLVGKITKDEERSLPRNCQAVLDSGNNKSGIYQIHPRTSNKPFWALCDMETKGGGWTHLQKRFDGSLNFYLAWREYKFGFGDLDGEFWIGLENIHHLTGFEVNELLIELTDREQKKLYAQYSDFAIGPEKDGYSLKRLEGFSGDAGDFLKYHLGAKFTTIDFDQDEHADNCAKVCNGGWWFRNCHHSNLNGNSINKPLPEKFIYQGLSWGDLRGKNYNFAGSRMLVRPISNK